MVIDCQRKEFLDAVQLAASPASGRATNLPLLRSLLVEANNSQLRLVGCDGEMWVERTFETTVSDPGATALDARLLGEILGSLPEGNVHLEQKNGQSVRLSHGQSDFRVVGMAAEDFPVIPKVSVDANLTLKSKEFSELVDSVDFAVATENQGRPVLTGVMFEYDGINLRTVATDTHRLAIRTVQHPGIGSAVSAIVPQRALNVIKKLPLNEDGEIHLSFGEGRLVVQSDGARVVSQLLAGQFPPYERVIPTNTTKSWLIDKDNLSAALKRCSILARDNSQRVVMSSNGNMVTMQSRSEGVGEGKEEVEIIAEGGDIEIAFNAKYLLDAIQPIQGMSVRIEMSENDRAVILKPGEGEENYLSVIMPMALP